MYQTPDVIWQVPEIITFSSFFLKYIRQSMICRILQKPQLTPSSFDYFIHDRSVGAKQEIFFMWFQEEGCSVSVTYTSFELQ